LCAKDDNTKGNIATVLITLFLMAVYNKFPTEEGFPYELSAGIRFDLQSG